MLYGSISKNSKTVAVIMAGGSGTRFWPLSRSSFPKQFLRLGEDGKSLIQETYERVKSVVDDVLVVTAEIQVDLVKEHLPGVCILAEPCPRNTAACVAYASKYVQSVVGNATMLFVPADHKIEGEQEYRDVFVNALALASQQAVLVTIGIVPTKPEIGYGYIKRGELKDFNSIEYFSVERFVEKPDLAQAEQYLSSGEYLWNSGVFSWSVSSILDSLAKYIPVLFKLVDKMFVADRAANIEYIRNSFPTLPSVSIDTAVMEKAANAVVIPGKGFAWSDIGSWESWIENTSKSSENLTIGDVIALDSKGCGIVAKDRLIAAIGVEDLVIVDAGDAILVCKKDRSQDVKKIVEILKQKGRSSIT